MGSERFVFLFTDIEASTVLARTLGADWAARLAQHHVVLRHAIEAHDGKVINAIGDAVLAVFSKSENAVAAAVEAQLDFGAPPQTEGELRVRMGIHAGRAHYVGDDLAGVDLHEAARIANSAHGGQIIVSDVAAADLDSKYLLDLGRHRLRSVLEPIRLFQVLAPGLPLEMPRLRSLGAPSNLPASISSLVGREDELATLEGLVEKGNRLITLTGPGGSGKTRLAIELASRMTDRFVDGVWLVELASLGEPSLVETAVATALGARAIGGEGASDDLQRALAGKCSLIVLDNCEHLIEACSVLADRLLRMSLDLQLVATSRESLEIGGEVIRPVSPLPTPSEREGDLSNIASCDAVELFVQRARAVDPGFELDQENAYEVAAICRRLDGIPLALELAAARKRYLSIHEMHSQLDDRFRLLSHGSRIAPDRHRTLEATIEWSYRLLDPDEASLWKRVACLPGGASVALATALSGLDPADVSAMLERLAQKSLLVSESAPAGSRYIALETLRAYAEKVVSTEGEFNSMWDDVLEWIANNARSLVPVRSVRVGSAALSFLGEEIENIRAALSYALENDVPAALDLIGGVWMWWRTRGQWSEGISWTTRALGIANEPSPGRTRVLVVHADLLCLGSSRFEAARDALVEALDSPGIEDIYPYAVLVHCWVAHSLGEPDESIRMAENSLLAARSSEDHVVAALALSSISASRRFRGDLDESWRLANEAVVEANHTGLDQPLGVALRMAGLAAHMRGDERVAESLLKQAVDAADRISDSNMRANALDILAMVALASGDTTAAETYYLQAMEIHEESADPIGLVTSLSGLGRAAQKRDDVATAADRHRQALRICARIGYLSYLPEVFAELADVAEHTGDPKSGAVLRGAAKALAERHGLGTVNAPADGVPTEIAEAWRAGNSMSDEQAIEFALT